MQGVALVPDDEAPRFDGQATSALLLPIHTFSTSQSHPGDQVIICSAEEMEHRPPRLPLPAQPVPASPVLAQATRDEIHPLLIAACASHPQTAIVPPDAVNVAQSPNSKNRLSRIRFLRDIARLRVHISISIAYAPSAEPAGSPTNQPCVEPVNPQPAPGSSFKNRFLRQAPKFFAQAKEIVIPQRVRSAIAAASASVAKTTRAAAMNFTAECVAEWNVLKACSSFCTEAFLRRCIRPSVAAVSRLAARSHPRLRPEMPILEIPICAMGRRIRLPPRTPPGAYRRPIHAFRCEARRNPSPQPTMAQSPLSPLAPELFRWS